MKIVFADTCYWVALLNPRDDHRQAAVAATQALGTDALIITTSDVITEVLNFVSGITPLRVKVAQWAQSLPLTLEYDPALTGTVLLRTSPEAWRDGLQLYAQRPDKSYSLTDCISMVVMERWGISEVLTHDHHFQQGGFRVLMRDDPE